MERIAIYTIPSPSPPCLWIHAVSVGEVEAATSLINRLKSNFDGYGLLVTTTTPTGSARLRSIYGSHIQHVYLPYDIPWCVNRFLTFFKPGIAIMIETEIWPNIFHTVRERGIPLVIANARLSPKSTRRYQYAGSLVKSTLGCVSTIAAQSENDRSNFLKIGALKNQIRVTGNIKFDIDLPGEIDEAAKALKKSLFYGNPVFICASTHEREDEQILETFAQIKSRYPKIILALAPRHPERFDAVARLCATRGYSLTRRSHTDPNQRPSDIFLIDSIGELKEFYGTAEIAFVGGSLVATGGHNVIEPAALKIPIIVGPHTFNFQDITEQLIETGAAIRITDANDLAMTVIELMADDRRREQMGIDGARFISRNRGAVDHTVKVVADLLGASRSSSNDTN